MAKDFEVEEGREVVRRTIVGGRPRSREKRKIRVPIGLEKVLCRAAGDAAFRETLLRDRGAALDASGYALLDSERAVLDSVPPAALETMIASIDVRTHGRKRFMSGVMAAAFAASATMAVADCGCTGIEPDYPPDDARSDVTAGDISPGTGDTTIVPDADPSRGISPDIIAMPDITADEGIRPDIVLVRDVSPDAGVPPDLVDASPPVPLGILPDVEPDIEDGDTAEVDVNPPAPTGILPDIDE